MPHSERENGATKKPVELGNQSTCDGPATHVLARASTMANPFAAPFEVPLAAPITPPVAAPTAAPHHYSFGTRPLHTNFSYFIVQGAFLTLPMTIYLLSKIEVGPGPPSETPDPPQRNYFNFNSLR